MSRLNIMTQLTTDFYFWLSSCLLITALLFLIILTYLLKIISKPKRPC